MVNISRVRAVWSGFVGGPGISTFYFTDTITAVPSVHAFFAGIRTWLPQDVHIQVESAGDILNNETGALIDSWVEDAVEVVVGDNDAAYSAPAGAVVDWLTSAVGPHRRIRGRTFLVPLSGAGYQNDGTLATNTRAALQAAADALVNEQSASFVVWHRGGGTTGSSPLVTSAFVPDMSAILRSRRD